MRQRIVLVVAVLVASIVVWQASTLAGRYFPKPAQPNIRTGAGASVSLGSTISSSATLSGGQSPSGNITFKLYASLADCNAGTNVLFTDTVPVNSGNGWYPFNEAYAPNSAGTYYWIASYSGDSNNQAATGACISVDVEAPFTSPPEATEQIPSTARIVCLRQDTRVLTPKAAAQPDGVHIQIDNRLSKNTYYSAITSDEEALVEPSAGGRVRRGISDHVVTELPPGPAQIECGPTGSYDSFEVVEGDSGYKSLELECKPGATPQYSSFMASGGGRKLNLVSNVDPLERSARATERSAREYFSRKHGFKGIKEGDVVEAAGYPEDPEPPARIVRNGKVVATLNSFESGSAATYCEGQI